MDADGWRSILTTKQFVNRSNELGTATVKVIKKPSTTDNLTRALESFLAYCLVPLGNKSGPHSIGIGKVLRRIAGKVFVSYVGKEVTLSVSALQESYKKSFK